jgi:hypothetical protein
MDYFAILRYSAIPGAFIERRIVDGVEQDCVVIPTISGQLKLTSKGYTGMLRLCETKSPDLKKSHDIKAIYDKQNKELNVNNKGKVVGYARPSKVSLVENINNENSDATDITFQGALCLDNIPESEIVNHNTKTITARLQRKDSEGTEFVCIGTVNLGTIWNTDIVVNPITGRRNLPCIIKKMKSMDVQKNTHVMTLLKRNGGEVEIGRFRELRKDPNTNKVVLTQETSQTQPQPEPQQSQQKKDIKPLKIDGFTF